MRRVVYKCHYRPHHSPTNNLIHCGALIIQIRDRFQAAAATAAAPVVQPARGAIMEPAADPGDAVDDPWPVLADFRWDLKSDRAITERDLAETLGLFQRTGELPALRTAFTAALMTMRQLYPHVHGYEGNVLLQAIALGKDFAEAVCASKDMYEYLKNEKQDVDLVSSLNINC